MSAFLTTLHVMVCISLVAVVLLQRGKGADIGAALGGGSSNTVFGGRGQPLIQDRTYLLQEWFLGSNRRF